MKTLSVKTYLFLLVASLLVVTLVFQLLLINLVKSRLMEEVDNKTLALSRQTMQFLQPDQGTLSSSPDNLTLLKTQQKPVAIRIRVKDISNQLMTINGSHGLEMGAGSQQVSIEPVARPAQPQLPIQLTNIADSGFVLSQRGDESIHQRVIQFDPQESAIQRYFSDLVWGLLLVAAIGLISAFFLAKRLSKPFGRLLQGFSKLASGQLGTHINPTTEFTPDEAQQAYDGFNRMSEQLQELDTLKRQLSQQQQTLELGDVGRGLAHSMRNPLNTIGLAVEQLAQTELDDAQKAELATQVRQKIRLMDKQIQGLLNLSGSNRAPLSRVNLLDVIDDILLELGEQANGIAFESPAVPATLMGNALELRAICHAPIINALEASQGKPVQLSVGQTDATVTLVIQDQGIGIDQSLLPTLFEPHVTSKSEGAGMGLYIARRLCRSFYRGDIKVANTHPGCRVEITLKDGVPVNE